MTPKEKLKNGQKIYGTMMRISRNPAVCYLAVYAGMDFIMFDCEHGDYTTSDLHDMFIMANSLGLSGFLRASSLAKEHISRPLDCGASGVMVPMTETAEQARTIAGFSKYPPVGWRGYSSGGAQTDYKGGKHLELMSQANNRVITIAQIETREAVDNAAAIAAVEGIDVLLIGPNDLSVSLGIPGDFFNPIELDAINHVADACKSKGKYFGLHAGFDLLEKFADKLDMVMCQTDTDILAVGMKDTAERCKKIMGEY
jgi:2-keto-3-deoxy-L-rhamnonate aldolase RhmA